MIGLGTEIRDVAEFNRRAGIALRGVDVRPEHFQILLLVKRPWERGAALDGSRQKALFTLIHRYRRQISDQMVTTYAALRAEGADS